MRKTLFVVMVALVAIALTACGGGAAAPEACAENPDETVCAVIEAGNPILIGYAGPMAGDYSAFGTDISQGGFIAIADAGELEGFSFELLTEDTGGSAEGGAAVANLYCSNPDVVAIAGHTFSGSTAAAIPVYNECRRPMLSPSATNPDLTTGDQDVFNRIPFTDAIQAQFAADYIVNTLGVDTIAVMHDGDTYGQGLAAAIQREFEALGGTVVAFQAITAGETDYSAPLTDIAALEPSLIYYGGYDTEAAVLVNQLNQTGLGDVYFMSGDGTFGEQFLELTGENGEGVIVSAAGEPEGDAVADFAAKYEEAYGMAPGSLSGFTWHGYDIVSALISAIEDVAILGEDGNLYVPREDAVAAVRGLTGFPGLTGTVTCDATGECNTSGPTFFVAEGGAWVAQ